MDLQKLKEKKIIIDDNFNEIQYIKVLNLEQRFATDTLMITVAPTLACNFSCPYCYEYKRKIRMTPDIQKKTIYFIDQRLKSVTNLGIWWYGGEPLLEKKIIWNMAEQLISLCKQHGCKYSAGMTTNGYLLDKRTALKLREQEVLWIQVTLDGPKEVHDKRRVLINGKGTFDRIIENLTNAVDIFSLVKIRVNLDKTNVNQLPELLDSLTEHGLKDKILIYYAPVFSNTSACQDIAENCFSGNEYSRLETQLFREIVEKGYVLAKHPISAIQGCGATHKNTFVIDPYGDIYKCLNIIGFKEEKIGNVILPLEYNPNHLKWLFWDPLSYKKCQDCRLLPACMGGCPYQTLRRNFQEPECREWKDHLGEMLQLNYKSYLQQKTEKNSGKRV